MLRKLLTILALIAGLTATVASAEARLAGNGGTRVEAAQHVHVAERAERSQSGHHAERRQGVWRSYQAAFGLMPVFVSAPAIRVKVDRARE